jgi:hypothetical protein
MRAHYCTYEYVQNINMWFTDIGYEINRRRLAHYDIIPPGPRCHTVTNIYSCLSSNKYLERSNFVSK